MDVETGSHDVAFAVSSGICRVRHYLLDTRDAIADTPVNGGPRHDDEHGYGSVDGPTSAGDCRLRDGAWAKLEDAPTERLGDRSCVCGTTVGAEHVWAIMARVLPPRWPLVLRYVCDRNGGVKSNYLRRKPWICPRCGETTQWNGHICQDCHHRVCCECFHHDLGVCLSSPGSDCKPCEYETRRMKRFTPCGA